MAGGRGVAPVTGRGGRVRRWATVLAMASVTTLGLSGCGGGSPQIDDDGIALDWVFTPSPVTAVASPEAFDWLADYRVTLNETNGQGGTITNVIVNVYENANGVAGTEAQANTVLEIPSGRIEPRGTTALDFDTHYTLANEGRAALIDVFVFLTDDAGFTTQIGRRLEAQ